MKAIKNVSISLSILFLTLSISSNSMSALTPMPAQSTSTPPSTSACVSINQNIYNGISGSEVKKLQRFLFEKGYLAAMPKVSKFGPSTVAAVKKFQADNNLIVTGNIGQISRDKIKEVSCGKTIAKTTVINLNDNDLATSSDPNVKFNGVIKIDDKMTFIQDQLTKFKIDATQLYLKYKDQDKNVEPLKTEWTKDIEAVFLKDLGVDKALTKNSGIFMYPEIGSILSEIQKQYPKKSEVISSASSVSNNKIVLSDINVSTVSITQLDKYLKIPLAFKVSNDNLAKEICRTEYNLDSKGADTFEPHRYCNGYYSPSSGVYSDVNFFSNFKSVISGTYETRDGKNYFENEGIYTEVLDFYVKDKNGAESNHIRFTFTR